MEMIIQTDVFDEGVDGVPMAAIRRHFPNATLITKEDVFLRDRLPRNYSGSFRGSLTLAMRLGRRLEWSNALNWMPALSQWLLRPDDYMFLDMAAISRRSSRLSWPNFIRPASGMKSFAGNLYTADTWANEFRATTVDRNLDPGTICVVAPPVTISREWRTVFVADQFVSGCRYMVNSEVDVAAELPAEVRAFAEEISRHPFFANRFDYVIDVGLSDGRLSLIEINAFETSGFYSCDLDEIYGRWAASLS